MRSQRGSVTAEFAVALPAVIVVLACCLAGLQVAGTQLRLQDAAALAARALARGDSPASALALVGGAALQQTSEGDLLCATLTAPAGLGLVIRATGCALEGGR
jgi:Flp pilus assembly protein TadG